MPNQRRDDLVGNGFDIERFSLRTHTRTLDEVLGATSRAHLNAVSEYSSRPEADAIPSRLRVRYQG
jgi:hypothetical protein